jgi:O-antigen biosynthesis protein
MTKMHVAAQLQSLLETNGWTIPQVAECLKQADVTGQLNEEVFFKTLLAWIDTIPHVAKHATGRRFTRLQFLENTLSAAGYYLTKRDMVTWLERYGDWRPDELLPYAPIDPRLAEQEMRIDQLEHDLHQMEVAKNRARAELVHVQAERDHFLATTKENIYKSVSADYQNSASWRVSKPLRRLMAWRRGEKFVEVAVQKPEAEALIPPWEQPDYNIKKAWQVEAEEDFDRSDYAEWLRRYDNPTADDLAAVSVQAQALTAHPNAPKFSLLMALDQPDLHSNLPWLIEAVTSVQAQMYPKWELCLAVSNQTESAVRDALGAMVAADSRIKLVHVPADQDLLKAASSMAVGDWLAVLVAINKIALQAINTLANVIFKDGTYDIVYADSDKLVAPSFERLAPDFKPDWNLDLFLSSGATQNYTQDLCFFKASLVRDLGGFSGGFRDSSSAGFEIVSRAISLAISRNESLQIHHIPEVLVHVRQTTAGARTIVPNKTQYGLPATVPMVSLIIPTKNNTALLRQCVDSILKKTNYPNYEILVVDNGSDQPETLDYLKTLTKMPRIRVIRDNYAFNYSALNNYAATFAKGEILALVNDDIEVSEEASVDWLTEMVSHALRPGVGAVGARLWYPNQTLQHAGMVLVGGVARHIHKHLPKGQAGFNDRAVLTQNFAAVTGACLVLRKALFEQVGGLNDQELAVGFNDVDLCLKLGEAGFRIVWTPHAELIHHESATRGQDNSPEKQRRAEKELRYMHKRWGDKLYVDPAYNPNLADGRDDMSFAWPPRKKT